MLQVTWKVNTNGFIEKLEVDGENIIMPWGIEFGDSSSFFSLTDGGWRNNQKVLRQEITATSIFARREVMMSEGRFILEYQEILQKNVVKRMATLIALEDSYLMDFVIRYRFIRELFDQGEISGQTILHKNSNIYYQYPVSHVTLVGGRLVHIQLTSSATISKTNPYMYIRDYKNEWIVHARILPTEFCREIVKLNTLWFNRALPDPVGHFLLDIPYLKNAIWYRSERAPYPKWHVIGKVFKPVAYGLFMLQKGKKIYIESSMELK